MTGIHTSSVAPITSHRILHIRRRRQVLVSIPDSHAVRALPGITEGHIFGKRVHWHVHVDRWTWGSDQRETEGDKRRESSCCCCLNSYARMLIPTQHTEQRMMRNADWKNQEKSALLRWTSDLPFACVTSNTLSPVLMDTFCDSLPSFEAKYHNVPNRTHIHIPFAGRNEGSRERERVCSTRLSHFSTDFLLLLLILMSLPGDHWLPEAVTGRNSFLWTECSFDFEGRHFPQSFVHWLDSSLPS